MDFINDINFITPISRGKFDILAKGADLINTAIGSAVDLNNVKTIAIGDLQAGRALPAWLHGGAASARAYTVGAVDVEWFVR